MEGKAQYQKWIQNECRNIVHILEDIKSCKPPIDHICELLPRLQPRYYSISSSSKLHPTTIHVTAVLVEYETGTGRTNKGVATTYLAEKRPTAGVDLPRVPIFIRKSQFRLPTRTETPVIMVGPGTGLAPFRGFIQERDLSRKDNQSVGDTILYFGCRKKAEDFIYGEVCDLSIKFLTTGFFMFCVFQELENYVKSGALNLRAAFSRDQAQKVYVTNLLQEDADLVWRIVGEKNGHVYICG